MTKLKLKRFSSLNAKKTFNKESGKEVILKADRTLFSQMIIIAESRKLEISDVLAHPLGPLPWSLAATDGSLRKTNKAVLGKELEKNVPPAETIPGPCATIIDGMSIVQRMKGDHKTFAELADTILKMILNEHPQSSRVDVVFDVYREVSIKNAERKKRNTVPGTQFKNICAGHIIQQWRRFLGEDANKTALISFLVSEWQEEVYRTKLQSKILYVTCEDQCYKITPQHVEIADDLKCTHEKADTRLLLHAEHASKNSYRSVIKVSEDTDVLALSLAFQSRIASSLYQKCRSQTRARFFDIATIRQAVGEELCNALPGIHSSTGCDTVSAFAGRGKVRAVTLAKRDRPTLEMFQQLGTTWHLPDDLFNRLQKFTCVLYSATKNTDRINTLRYNLFCAKKGECQRANYQAAVWRLSLEACLASPPARKGWSLDTGSDGVPSLSIDWMPGQPAPLAVLELLSCKFSRKCSLPDCPCMKNGL